MNDFEFSTKVENSHKYGIFEKQIPPPLNKKLDTFCPFSPIQYKTFFFRPILADFFIPSRNTFFYVYYLRMNSTFFKKVKITLGSQILPKKKTHAFLAFSLKFWSFLPTLYNTSFFQPIFSDFLIPSRNVLL